MARLAPCVWIAFRLREPDVDPPATWTDWLRDTVRFQHAQIAIPVPCTPALGAAACTWCVQGGYSRSPGRDHALTFTVNRGTGVTLRVDQPYREQKWELWSLPATEDGVRRLRGWLVAQVGGACHEYALERNAFWALWCGCCPVRCALCCVVGVRRGADNPARLWFCTELCVAALQQIGYCASEQPCCVTPDRLARLVARLPGAVRVS